MEKLTTKAICYVLILFTTIAILLSSCSDNEGPAEEGNPIKLSKQAIQVLAGVEESIEILSEEGLLAASSGNSQIASAWWTNGGKSVLIKTHSTGHTTIYITDKESPDRIAEILVESNHFEGDFKLIKNKCEVYVFANDAFVKEAIETDLNKILDSQADGIYNFNKSNNSVKINSPTGKEQTGTYRWEINTLTTNIDNIQTVYQFGVLDNNSVMLEINLVKNYEAKYPEDHISAAKLGLFLSRI